MRAARWSVFFAMTTMALGRMAAQASVVAYEPFDYPAGTLNNKNGGQGFLGPWQDLIFFGGPLETSGDAASLVYPSGVLLPRSGRRIDDVAGGRSLRILGSQLNFGTEGTFYLSALVKKDSSAFDALLSIDLFDANRGESALVLGAADDNRLFTGTSATFGLGPALASSTGYLLVAKVLTHADSPDEYFAALFPANEPIASTLEPSVWPLSFQTSTNAVGNSLYLTSESSAGGEIDEIRLGTSWRDVFGPEVRLVGDANFDCVIGAGDYAVWASQFGQSGLDLPADFDRSGSIGAGDYSLWASHFGSTCPPEIVAVPEPAAYILLACASLLLGWARGPRRIADLKPTQG